MPRRPAAGTSRGRTRGTNRPTASLPAIPLVRLSRRTLQDNVYEYVRESLMGGQYAPGDRLTAREVASALGTSVMPVREAFRRLTSEGALEPQSTGATRVP